MWAAELALQVRHGERARYSRALHDRVLQTMEVLAVSPEIRDDTLRRHLADEVIWLRRLVEDGVTQPAGDLVEALTACVGGDKVRPVAVSLDVVEGQFRPRIPAAAVEAIVGAVDEALTNVAKHSGCPQATVRVLMDRQVVGVVVMDEGRGIEPESLARGGFGLTHSIKGRMSSVGGTGVVRRASGGGTVVDLTLPIGRKAGKRR